MMVKEVMRRASALDEEATLGDVLQEIERTGCEALPVIQRSNGGSPVVCQIVAVRDLPYLRTVAASAMRGHAVGGSVLDLLAAIGRKPGRFPTIAPNAALADAWGMMSDAHLTHLPGHGRRRRDRHGLAGRDLLRVPAPVADGRFLGLIAAYCSWAGSVASWWRSLFRSSA